ncbi:MAG: DegT/DnrJ/EryC1/StrS family aminotransferase, partial [Cyclobacteriaceae bacterium]
IIGFNCRISELHAAVGAAQTRKVPQIREINRKYKKRMMEQLGQVPGVSFAHIPDPAGDSATFLNLLLPDTATAKKTVDLFNQNGIGGFNYRFINMYHFINQWDHLKNLKTAAPLPIHLLGAPQDYNNLHLPKSQEVVGRLISFGIRCSWKEEELEQLIGKIKASLEKALGVHAHA